MSHVTRIKFYLALTLAFLVLVLLLPTSYTRNSQAFDAVQSDNERHLESLIPKHVPVSIQIKKEKEKDFKDLQNEAWARNLELEITNTGDKPIYALYLMLITELKWQNGDRVVFPVHYGRPELGAISVKASADDIPIKPHESIVIKLNPSMVLGWETTRPKEKLPHPKKVDVKLEILSFGDGTGYVGNGGTAIPRKITSSNCEPTPRSGPNIHDSLVRLARQTQLDTQDFLPAILPVNFFESRFWLRVIEPPAPTDPCCPYQCTPLESFTEVACFGCVPQVRFNVVLCSNPFGVCSNPIYDHTVCTLPTGKHVLVSDG